MTFYGIRRSESVSRSKYDRESDSPKITKQRIISPIIDWMDFDIWLYILTTGIDFNDAYRLGYARVGCWCCPNNSGWSEFLSKVHMHEQSKHFREMLIDFATSIGKEDAEVYVDDGYWKARQGEMVLRMHRNPLCHSHHVSRRKIRSIMNYSVQFQNSCMNYSVHSGI